MWVLCGSQSKWVVPDQDSGETGFPLVLRHLFHQTPPLRTYITSSKGDREWDSRPHTHAFTHTRTHSHTLLGRMTKHSEKDRQENTTTQSHTYCGRCHLLEFGNTVSHVTAFVLIVK